MELEVLDCSLTVCKTETMNSINMQSGIFFLCKTDEEISLVCRTEDTPENTVEREDGWRAFRVKGVLDFSLVGILARIASALAENGISLFAVSTFNTDYVLVKEERYEQALKVLDGLSG